jgi:hypothetical protein
VLLELLDSLLAAFGKPIWNLGLSMAEPLGTLPGTSVSLCELVGRLILGSVDLQFLRTPQMWCLVPVAFCESECGRDREAFPCRHGHNFHVVTKKAAVLMLSAATRVSRLWGSNKQPRAESINPRVYNSEPEPSSVEEGAQALAEAFDSEG